MANASSLSRSAPVAHRTASVLPIDVVADVVCPWCYIGKHRLDAALAMRPDIPVKLRWRPYLLNPSIPRAGIERKLYLMTKFGSLERYAVIGKRVASAAAGEGLNVALDKISRQPNTLDCHRLIWWAGQTGAASLMTQRLMELYFSEGADLSDPAALVGAAVACGMSGDVVGKLLESNADVARIEHEDHQAKAAGIDGVPYCIFGNAVAIAGAQSPASLAELLDRAFGFAKRTGNNAAAELAAS